MSCSRTNNGTESSVRAAAADSHARRHAPVRARRRTSHTVATEHAHDRFQIYSYILSGSLQHEDSMGNVEVVTRGDVQLTRSGRGISHSEHNASDADVAHLLQIWIAPPTRDLDPSYDTKRFDDDAKRNRLCLIVSPDGAEGSLRLDQDARMWASLLGAAGVGGGGDGSAVPVLRHTYAAGRAGYVHVPMTPGSCGLLVNGKVWLKPGDGAYVERGGHGKTRASSTTDDVRGDTTFVAITDGVEGSACEFVLFDIPAPKREAPLGRQQLDEQQSRRKERKAERAPPRGRMGGGARGVAPRT